MSKSNIELKNMSMSSDDFHYSVSEGLSLRSIKTCKHIHNLSEELKPNIIKETKLGREYTTCEGIYNNGVINTACKFCRAFKEYVR